VNLDDPALRVGALAKFSHAMALGESLSADMHAWWDLDPVKLELVSHDDQRTLEVQMLTSPLPSMDNWYQRAGDILHNFRTALNRLAYGVAFAHTTPKKPDDSNFPIHKGQEGWEGWLRKHPELPDHVVQRFYAFEPFVTGRPALSALTNADNLEKHENGFEFAVTLTEMNMGFETKVEGFWEKDGLAERVGLVGGSTTDLTAPTQTIATITLPTPILELSAGNLPKPDGLVVTPMLRVDGDEIPLMAAFSHIGHEVAWAISYITGLTSDSQAPPKHFDL
jgi:hypothetical protein